MSATPHPDHPSARWSKSSYSNGSGGECVETTTLDRSAMAVRDSKDPCGPVLTFGPDAWRSFLDGIKGTDFGN